MTDKQSPPMDLDQLKQLLAEAPFHHMIEVELVDADFVAGEVTMRLRYKSGYGRLKDVQQYHGGVIASLADTAATFAIIARIGRPAATIELTTSYLRPATTDWIEARATTQKAGRTIGFADVSITDSNARVVALARACISTFAG